MNEIQNIEATPAPKAAPAPASPAGALLTGAALLGGAALLARPKAARAQSTTNKPTIVVNETNFGSKAQDFLVLNFALSLEALEAELYIQALQRLTTGGTGGAYALPGLQIQGLNLPVSKASVDYVIEFGKVERAHRNFLAGALGQNAIIAPGKPLDGVAFDFGFGGTGAPNEVGVVQVVLDAEALGVRAYTGAVDARFFSSINSPYLQTAAAIEGTEARHTAVVTAILNGLTGQSLPVAPLPDNNGGKETPLEPQLVINTVRPFIFLRGEGGNTGPNGNPQTINN